MTTPADARRLLGVSADASTAEITCRYRTLAHGVHPDHGGDPERFRALAAAYVAALDAVDDVERDRSRGAELTTHTTSLPGRVRRLRKAFAARAHRPTTRARSRLIGGPS